MPVPPRPRALAFATALALCVSLVLPSLGLAAAAAPRFTKETEQAYEGQLKKGEIAGAAVNHAIATVRLTLKNGHHYVFHYTAGGQKAVEAQLTAHGVKVTKVKPKKKKSKTLGSHPRRTIAIIVVVVVVIALAVFLLIRRRRLMRD